jgi:sugar/nucleoside kinase (ribokinase family)
MRAMWRHESPSPDTASPIGDIRSVSSTSRAPSTEQRHGKRLCTVGRLTIDDLVFWPSGRTLIGQPGGNSLYSALGARVWMQNVSAITRQGRDYPVDGLEHVMSRVHLVLIPVDAPSMSAWGLYEGNGDRQWLPHPGSGTQDQMTPRPDELPAELLSCEAFHLASMPPDQQLAWAVRLQREGTVISADSMPVEVIGSGGAAGIDRHVSLLGLVDFYLPSSVEARLLFGSDDPEAAAKAFSNRGPKAVVVKLGPEGSLVYDALSDQFAHVPALGDAVDPTGAGDAFCGGFLAGYLITGDAVAAAQHGSVSASLAVESLGMASLMDPDRNSLDERLATVRQGTSPGR